METAPASIKAPPSCCVGKSISSISSANTPIPNAAGIEITIASFSATFILLFTILTSPAVIDAAIVGIAAVAIADDMDTGSVVSVTYLPESCP